MELKDIRKIVELMDEHGLSLFHLEKEDFNLKLKKGPDLDEVRDLMGGLSIMSAPPSAAPAAPVVGGTSPSAAPEEPVENGRAITSPMVGTFYRKPAPDADDFVSVGDTVREGQTLCIIEAMKVMNEIKAETSGTIVEACAEDASPVQYGDVLFRIK